MSTIVTYFFLVAYMYRLVIHEEVHQEFLPFYKKEYKEKPVRSAQPKLTGAIVKMEHANSLELHNIGI